MTLAKPSASPLFATDPLFTSGSEVGLAPRLDPGAIRAQGILPESRIGARWLNYMLGVHGDLLKYVDDRFEHDCLKFTRTDLGVSTSNIWRLTPVLQTTIGTVSARQRAILVTGTSAISSAVCTLSNDGTAPAPISTISSSAGPNSAPAADNNGVIFVGIAGGTVVKSTDGGATSSAVTVTGLTGDASWVGFTANHYLLFEGSTKKIYNATSLAGTWTSAALTASAVTVHDLITDGAGTWLLVATVAISPTVVYRSTDDGVTWSSAITIGSSFPTSAGGSYSVDDGLFYVLNSLGELYSSPTGASGTWTLVKTMSNLIVAFGQNTVAACGPVIACVVNRANSISKFSEGIAYTIDKGATWNEIYFGPSDSSSFQVRSLISANGRLYAADGRALYQSGILSAPAPVFAGV